MEVSFKKRYASESEFLYDLAQSSPYFRSEDFKAFSDIEQADVYTSTIIAARDKVSNTFDTKEYDLLAGQDRLSYLYNEYLQDKTETAVDEQTGETYNVYERNKQYLNARLDEAIDAKTFDSLNGFEKVMHTIGGVVGNALNDLFFGTVEGLVDVFATIGGGIASIVDAGAGEEVKKFVASDATGYRSNQEDLQRYARAYTYIDKSGAVKVINDVVSGIAKMAPMLIPYAGTAIYFSGMAGNTAEEAVRANPDINYAALIGYTGAVTAVEFATEKISSGIFGGSAIDNLMFKSSKNVLGGWVSRIGFNFASEGFEEMVAEFADSVLYTAMVDNNAPLASIEEILYAGLIGGLIGGVTGGIEIATAQRLTINGKQLTKLESLAYQGQLQNAIELTKKSAVDSLMVKYSNLNIEQIKTQHAQEYQNAVEKDNKTTRKLAEASIALAKLVEIAGVEKIQNAAKLVDYQIESYANLMKKYVAHATSNIISNRAVEEKFATKNPGQSITINDVLTENQRKLKQELKSAYGIDAYFGNLGARDGLIKNNGLTLDEKTIVIDDRLFNEMSLDQIMTTVVREELVHTLQFGEGKLTKETLNKLREIYTQQGGKIQEGGDLDLAYSRSSTLTKQAELEAKAICQMLLFDEITISRVFSTNTNVFFKVFNTLKNLKKNIESKKTKRTNKDKVRFREILKAMGRYKDAAANNIGNKEDLDMVADKMDLDDADAQDIADKMLPNYDTEHFTQLMDSFTMSVAKHKEATNFLLNNRQYNLPLFFPTLLYSKVFDETYYTADFVQRIKARNPEQDFRYNLQETMINDFGFTINDKAGALMEVVDLTEMTTEDFRYDITDLAIDSSRIDKYTNLAQIFKPDFVAKFNTNEGNGLERIKINIIKTTNDTSTKATYNHHDKVITIKLNANKLTNFAESDALKHSILHETVHALSALQNLAWGTSSKYIRSGLNVLPTKTINSLAEKLLTKEFYEQNKGKLDVLLDNIAYGIYRITDSEYAAEAYKTSKWRKKDIELKLKAGATMNRSGFYISDFGKLSGYGRFAGIEIKLGGEQLVSQENVKSKNLQDATEVVAYSRVSTIGEFIKNKGYKDFESAGFSEDAIKVFSDPDSKYGDVQALLNTNNVGSEEATNLIIEWLNANKSKSRLEGVAVKNKNEHMVTAEDINKAKFDGIAMAYTYHEYRLDNDPAYKGEKPLTYEYLKEFFEKHPEVRDTKLLTSSYEDSKGNLQFKEGYQDEIVELILDDRNAGLTDYLIRIDYDYSKSATDNIYKALRSFNMKGINAVSENVRGYKGAETTEFNVMDEAIAEQYAEGSYNQDPAKLLEGIVNDDVSEDKFKNMTVDKFIAAASVLIKKLSNSPDYFTFEKNITDSSKKVNKGLKRIYGEDGFKKIKEYVQSNMSSREKFNKQRKRRLEKISKIPNLSAEAKKLVAQPYTTFSPIQYKKYIAFLDKLIETNEKRQAQKAQPVVVEVKEEPITVKEKSIDMRPSAIVAPYLANNILNQKDYNKSKKAVDEKFKNAAQALAKDLGLEIEEVHNNLGGYTFGAGESITELSYTFIFKEGDFETIKLFASIMGDIAHETQESVVASQPLSEDSDAQPDALRLTYTVKDVKGVEKILKKLGINDFTIDKVNNTVSVLSFDVEDVDKLKTYPKEKIQEKIDAMLQGYEQLEQELGDNLDGKEFEFIKSSLLESNDRRELYKAWLDSAKVQKQKGDAGDSSIQQAIQQALQQIDKKYPVQQQTPVVQIQESENIPAADRIENVAKEIDNIQNIDAKKPNTITKAILDKYSQATTDISEAQFFDDTDMIYQTVGEEIFNDLLPIFAAINEDNYQTIRDELKASKEFYADQALVLFDMYTLECEGRFSQETQNKIRAYNRRELTKAAQRLNRQAKRVLEKKGVTDLVRSFRANDIEVTVTDKIVGDIFPELADKEKRIEELEQQIKELNNELKSMQDLSSVVVSLTNQIEELKSQQEKATQDSEEYKKLQNKIDELTEEVDEKQAKLATTEDLYAKLKEASQEALILKNGSNEDIVDFFIQKLEEKGIVGSERAAQKLKDLLEKLVLSGRINRTGESLDFHTIDKDGKPMAFPKLVKVLEAAKSFRMWAMLSSPVTYVRNWMGNLGMKGLEAATNFMSRHIEKELSDEKFNELETKKKAAVEQVKKAKSVVKDADKNIAEYKKQLDNKDLSNQEKQDIKNKIDDASGQKDIAETQLADLDTEIKGYEFQQDQFNIASKKATDETIATVEKFFDKQIEGLVSGTVKYAKEDERTQQAITTKTEALQLKAKEGTWWERTKAKAELYELKGLETGWFGDRRIVRSSLKKNFANMLESNKAKFIRDLRNEKTRLESKKELSEKDRDKLNLIDKALQSERMEDIVQAVPQAHIELLLDKALTITQKQYFKNSNALSRLLYNVGRKNPMLGTVVSFILPFPKVAYNVLATAIEYSPLGFLKALAQGSVIKQMEKGDYKNMSGFEKAERAQTISKASVGTMMFIAGAIAAALGWVDVEEDDYLGVSLHINLGADIRISLSNLAPSMTTFSASAAMIWAFKEGKGFNGAMKQILSTLYDNTLLGNVENIFAYGSLENWASNASISWISQYIPAIVKLVTKTIDPRKKDKSGNYWNKLIKTLGSYLPGISTLVPSKIDPYTGQEVYNTGTSNWFLNFIAGVSPLDIDLANNYKTNLQLEAERLGAETTGLSGKFTINGKDFVVSDKEKYARYRANYINTQYQKIISGKEKVTIEDENGKRKTTTYDKLTNEQKKNVLNRLYSDATSKTKIKAWVEEGNYYYTSNRDEYNELRKLLNNNKIIYRSSWSKSKFVNK